MVAVDFFFHGNVQFPSFFPPFSIAGPGGCVKEEMRALPVVLARGSCYNGGAKRQEVWFG